MTNSPDTEPPRAKTMKERGLTMSHVADEFGVHVDTLRKRLRFAGIAFETATLGQVAGALHDEAARERARYTQAKADAVALDNEMRRAELISPQDANILNRRAAALMRKVIEAAGVKYAISAEDLATVLEAVDELAKIDFTDPRTLEQTLGGANED